MAQPDVGLVSMPEFCKIIRENHLASGLPVIADADTGFGEEEMVRAFFITLAAYFLVFLLLSFLTKIYDLSRKADPITPPHRSPKQSSSTHTQAQPASISKIRYETLYPP